MNASDLFKAGHLAEAIDEQIREVRSSPADQAKRVFLFEMLAFSGDLDRAKKQIEAVNYSDIERDSAVQAYRRLLDAEDLRRKLFSEGKKPGFFGSVPEHVQKRLDAIAHLQANRVKEATASLAQAADGEAPVKGLLNDKPFDSLRDCDDVFGPVLEVMAHGAYYWVPLEQIDSLSLNPPKFPRDLLWFPAKLAIKDGPAGDVFLPTLYPGSHASADNGIKLGRKTDWQGNEGEPVRGVGLKLFLVGEDALPLLDWRQVQIV